MLEERLRGLFRAKEAASREESVRERERVEDSESVDRRFRLGQMELELRHVQDAERVKRAQAEDLSQRAAQVLRALCVGLRERESVCEG